MTRALVGNDLNTVYGDWWLANLEMASALVIVGYDVTTATASHGWAILPDVLLRLRAAAPTDQQRARRGGRSTGRRGRILGQSRAARGTADTPARRCLPARS